MNQEQLDQVFGWIRDQKEKLANLPLNDPRHADIERVYNVEHYAIQRQREINQVKVS